MKKFIVPAGGFLILSFVFGVLFFVQVLASDVVDSYTKIGEGVCTFESWTVSEGDPVLNLDCNGKKASTRNADVVVAYVKKPGPLNCSIWKSGTAVCKVPE